jgi:hypothetical protein
MLAVSVTGVTDVVHPFVQFGGIDFASTGDQPMLRFVLSAMALAGILTTMLPALADPLSATAADHAQVAAAATALAAPSARLSPSAAPEPDGHGTEIIPVGPGWG